MLVYVCIHNRLLLVFGRFNQVTYKIVDEELE